MKKCIVFIMILWMVLMVVPAAGQESQSSLEAVTFFSEILGDDIAYNVYLPAGYADSQLEYPVIYLLHGRGDSMSAWTQMRGTLDDLIANEEIPPIIAIMPNVTHSGGGSYYVDSQHTGTVYPGVPIESVFINDLIPHVDSTYRTIADREGRAVGGYSMGGYGAIRYTLAYPELFKGAIVLSPAVYTPLPPVDSSAREFGAFGKGDSLFDEEIYQSLNYPALLETVAQRNFPIYMFIAVGDDEWKHPNPEDQWHDLDLEAHFLFNAVSRVSVISSEFRVYNGGHDWTVWERGFVEGARYIFRTMAKPGEVAAAPMTGTQIGTAGEDMAGGVAVDGDGNVIQALSAEGSVHDQDYEGGKDVVLTKSDPSGGVLWTQQFGTPAAERAYGVALDEQGSIYVVGYTSGDLDGSHAGNAADDAFLAKYNASGQREWMQQFGDPAEADRGYGLAVGHDGSIVVTGYTRGTLEAGNAGDKDVIVVKFAPDGSLLWLRQLGGAGEDKAYSVTLADDGSIFVAGMTGSELNTASGELDGFIAHYDVDGNQQWITQAGTPGWDEFNGVAILDETILVSGFSAGDFGGTLAGDKDIIAAAFDRDGVMLWTDQIGSDLNDKGAAIQVADDGFYLVGFSDGEIENSFGSYDVVIVKYDVNRQREWVRQYGTFDADGADQWAEANLYTAFSDDTLYLTGFTMGSVGDQTQAGLGDVFLARFASQGDNH